MEAQVRELHAHGGQGGGHRELAPALRPERSRHEDRHRHPEGEQDDPRRERVGDLPEELGAQQALATGPPSRRRALRIQRDASSKVRVSSDTCTFRSPGTGRDLEEGDSSRSAP